MTKPSRSTSKGRQATSGVVVAGGHGPDHGEGAVGERGERRLDAAGQGHGRVPVLDQAEGLADGDRAGGAGVGVADARGRGCPARSPGWSHRRPEDGEGQGGVDGAQAAGEVAGVLGLGEGDPAERAAQVDGRLLRAASLAIETRRRRAPAGRRPGRTGRSGRGASPGAGPCTSGVEAVDLGGDVRAERGGIEAGDPGRARTARGARRPRNRCCPRRCRGGHGADPGDGHPAATRTAHVPASARRLIRRSVGGRWARRTAGR